MSKSCAHCHEKLAIEHFKKKGRGHSKICEFCEDPVPVGNLFVNAMLQFFLENGWYSRLEELVEPHLAGPLITRKIRLKDIKTDLLQIFGEVNVNNTK